MKRVLQYIVTANVEPLASKTSYCQISWSLRSPEIICFDDGIALKFDRHIGSTAADVPDKFQSDWKSLNLNLTASRLHEIFR